MSNGRSYLNTLNSATVPSLFSNALAAFSNQQPDLYGFGQILRSMTPGLKVRTGLASLAAHTETLPGRIFGVTDEAGAVNLTMIYAGAPGVGEVLVEYSTTDPVGVPTLTFNAAVTGYQVEKAELPPGFDEVFDAIQV